MIHERIMRNSIKHPINPILLFVSIIMIVGCGKPTSKERLALADVIENSIQTELLNVWYPRAVDSVHGGFLSTFTYDWKPTGSQDKMIVTQARHIWSNSKASKLYPDNPVFKKSANHGFLFLRDVMWDKTYGGFYNLVDRPGHPKEEIKP